MTNYIPKYQFSAIAARRASKAEHKFVTLQRRLKSGKWGKPFAFEKKPEYRMQDGKLVCIGLESDEKALERFVKMNTTTEYRIAQ